MKKELCAIVALLVLIAGAFGNLIHLKNLMEQICAHVDYSILYCSLDDYIAAHTETSKAQQLWENSENYTHVFIRHSDIDSFSDLFFDILSAVQDREKYEAEYLLEKLRYHAESIVDMETFSIRSIF